MGTSYTKDQVAAVTISTAMGIKRMSMQASAIVENQLLTPYTKRYTHPSKNKINVTITYN
jgi:hypothetical protein